MAAPILERKGYTVQYLDPEGLAEPGVVGDGVLFPQGPRYCALVVDERAVPVLAAAAMAKAAAAGLSIVFVGTPPDQDTTYGSGAAGNEQVRRLIQQALKGRHVRRCASQGDVVQALDSVDLAPRVACDGVEVLTQLREADGIKYLYLYNPTNSEVSFSPAIEGDGAVFDLNLWYGSITPTPWYDKRAGRLAVPITLQAKEARVVAVDSRDKQRVHVVADGPDISALVANGDGTTLRNAVTKYNKTSTRTDPYGLRGPVRVEPFSMATVYSP